MAKTVTIGPQKKGQKPLKFKEGALTAMAKAAGFSSASAYCNSGKATSALARKR